MTVAGEQFDYFWNKLTHVNKRKPYEQKRYHKALLAMSCQNYFFSADYLGTGTAGNVGVDQTSPVDRAILIRGCGFNAKTIPINNSVGLPDAAQAPINLQISRTGTGRSQISLNPLRSCAYASDGQGQPWELDWPAVIRLDPNESLQVKFTEVNAASAGFLFAVNFYGVAVDPAMQCDPDILKSVCEQIRNTDMRTVYWNLKTPNSGGTISYPTSGIGNQINFAVTDKAPAHLLIHGFRRNDALYIPRDTTLRISSGDGHAFSREEIAIKGFEYFNSPDSGYFRFTTPHFIREGQSLNAQITSNPGPLIQEYEGEINLVCTTV